MKYDYSDKLLPSSYPRGSNSGSSGDVGDSSGDENSYGEEVVQLQRRRQRTPPSPLKAFVNKVAGKVYQQTHLLGEGSYGYVHVAVDENGDKVALKTFKVFDINDADVENERRACMTIRDHKPHHPNVVTPISYFRDGMIPCLTMELCSSKTLDSLLEARNTLEEHEVRYFGQQLVAGAAHLHSLNLVHNDLKPHNLLLTEDLVLKVGDFGQMLDLGEGKELHDVVGSLGFQAPEVLRRERLTNALDVFSIGAILFRMLLGVVYKLPGKTTAGKTNSVKIDGGVSANAKDLLQRTLEDDPERRIKMSDLIAHPFLTDGPIPQSVSWDILNKATPLATEDNTSDTDGNCQGEDSKSQNGKTAETLEEPRIQEEEEEAAHTQEEVSQTHEEGALAQEVEAELSEPVEPNVDLDDVDLDDIFAEVEEAKKAKALFVEGAKNQKGNKDVAICGGKKVWEDDSDDEEEEVKGCKKVKVMQGVVVSEKKAPEDKEGGHGGDQDAWPTYLFSL